ncbi:hypothetical protein PAPHI01_0007 [Pancytospora philotis]|nr:hypothetical protein PAPHI01_0007 [Pancytospora philotis]
MGSKKSKRVKARPLKPAAMENRFDCMKCNHEKVVQCKISKEKRVGYAFCTVCEANFKCKVHQLDKPIDIYYAWMDCVADSS